GRRQLGVPASPHRGQVAGRQLVQGRVPGEVRALVGRRSGGVDPVVEPGETGGVVAGLVVHVGPSVRRVAGGRLLRQRAGGEVVCLVEPPLLLPDEREQPRVPPVRAVRGGAPLDDGPRLLRHGRDTGEGDGRDGGREQQRVP